MEFSFSQIPAMFSGFVLASAAGIVTWAIKRGLRSEANPKKERHTEPCDAHLRLENVMAEDVKPGLKEIFKRLENHDQAFIDILKILSELRAEFAISKAKTIVESFSAKVKEKGKRILLLFVDDRPASMMALVSMIEDIGFDVLIVSSEDEAREAINMMEFAAAVVDASLTPNTYDGVQLADWIANKNHKPCKVFIFTGHDLDMSPRNCELIEKPNAPLLLERLRQVYASMSAS